MEHTIPITMVGATPSPTSMASESPDLKSPPSHFIKRSLKYCSFTWIIEDFRRRREKMGEPIVSPTFVADDENSNESNIGPSFKVFFYPNGTDEHDQTACFLWVEDSKYDSIKARFQVAILDKMGEGKVKKVCPFMVRGVHHRAGWNKFYPKRRILDALNQLIVNGQITLVVDIFFIEEDVSPEQVNSIFNLASVFCPRTPSGCEEFRKLFEDKNFDICVKVKDRNLPAHRMVLSSSSHVMEKILIRDRRTFFIIDDFDGDVVADAIFFMYHRTFESEDPDFFGLLRFAERYKIPAMKFSVEQELYEVTSDKTVIDLYRLAHECNSTLLTDALKYVIIENSMTITESKGWKDLLETDPDKVTDLFNMVCDEVCKRMG